MSVIWTIVRAIFVWTWNENMRIKEKQQTNGYRAIWLPVYWTNTNTSGFWLVTRMLTWKNFMPENFLRNKSILCFNIILQHDWPIEQCPLHNRAFFGGKTKNPCFDLLNYWLIKQITNTYWNHFSRSQENRSILFFLALQNKTLSNLPHPPPSPSPYPYPL